MSVNVFHFWSDSCAPCKHIKPAVADLKEEFDSYKWHSINIKADTVTANKFKVTSIPCIVVLKDGIEIGRHSGTAMMHYYSILRKAIQK